MHRFFCPNADFTSKKISISDKNEIHHIMDVLRMKKDDSICVFNDRNEEATGTISEINPAHVDISIKSIRREKETKKIHIALACAIPKKAKFELIIEKCTELGIDEIIPMITQRTEVKFDSKRAIQKSQRYKNVAINAAKQCGRINIPVIQPITSFKDAIQNIKEDTLALIPCLEGNRKNICDIFPVKQSCPRILFFIGPEGDFTQEEVSKATKAGCIPVSLGETVLKVDTAAISVVALANFHRYQ